MLPGCHSWDHPLPAEEVRLPAPAPWLHGKSCHNTGQPQEMEQMNSLPFPCSGWAPDSTSFFPWGFLPLAGGWWTPFLWPQRLLCAMGSALASQMACKRLHIVQNCRMICFLCTPKPLHFADCSWEAPRRHCTSIAGGAHWRRSGRSSYNFSSPLSLMGCVGTELATLPLFSH